MLDPTNIDFEKRLKYFKVHLEEIKQLPFLSYSQMLSNKQFGLYFVFYQSELIYIGKTNREGNKRIREMATDFRSHTLNRKLLSKELELFFNDTEQSFTVNNQIKKQLLDTKLMSSSQFNEIQLKVRSTVKEKFEFKFYPLDKSKLTEMEYFLIGFFNPNYNN